MDTIVTYVRSAHAFCSWLVHQGLLTCSPFSDMDALKADPLPIRVVEAEFLLTCWLVASHRNRWVPEKRLRP